MQTKTQKRHANELAAWLECNLPKITIKNLDEYRNVNTPITFLCSEHGEFIRKPGGIKKNKHGCVQCAKTSQNMSYQDFIDKAKFIHGDAYEYYDEIDSEWKRAKDYVKIYCSRCQYSFRQRGHNHLRGGGCPICSWRNRSTPYTEFIVEAKQKHGNRYHYYSEKDSLWKSKEQKVRIYCPICKQDFFQRGGHHLEGCGCPTCNKGGSGGDNEINFRRKPELAKEQCTLYYIKVNDIYKIGISKNLSRRFIGEQYQILQTRETTRYNAWRIEQNILQCFAQYRQYYSALRSGNTECFHCDISNIPIFAELFNQEYEYVEDNNNAVDTCTQ